MTDHEQHERTYEKDETTEVAAKAETMHDPGTEEDTASGGPADPPDDDA